jgi:hypothetical protein
VEVLRGAGFDEAEITALLESRAVYEATRNP